MDKDTSKPKKDRIVKAVKDVKKAAKGAAEYLGLYPEDEDTNVTPIEKSPCNSDNPSNCDIREPHKHVNNRVPYSPAVEADLDNSVSSHPAATRPQHFDTGATEHLPEGVVSLNKYRESKAARRPQGY